MAEFIRKQRRAGRLVHEEELSLHLERPGGPSRGRRSGQERTRPVLANAQQTIDNIDKTLAKNAEDQRSTEEDPGLAAREFQPEEPDEQGQGALSPLEVKGAETDPQEDSLYNPGEVRRGSTRLSRRRLFLLGAGVTITLVGIVSLIMSFATMLFPSLLNNMENHRLARFTRNLIAHTDIAVKTKIALATTNDARYAELLQHYGGDFNNNTLWAKINRFQPEKVAERLALDLTFEVVEEVVPGTGGTVSRQRIVAVRFGNPPQRIELPPHGFGWQAMKQKVFHPVAYINSLLTYRAETKRLVDNLLGAGNPSWMTRVFQRLAVRSQSAAELRRVLDIKTYRWGRAEVQRAYREGVQNPVEEEMARSHRDAATTASGGSRIPVGADADARQSAAQTTACTKNVECMQRMINNGDTLAPEARAALEARFDPNNISGVVGRIIGTASTIADLGNLACKMYDASIMSSGDIINANSAMAVATYSSFAAATDQRIYSDQHPEDLRINDALQGGYETQVNGQVGPTPAGGAARSNIYKKAQGLPVDTTESLSPQASAIGSFATNPFGFLPGTVGIAMLSLMGDPDAMGIMNFAGFGDDIDFCDVVTNKLFLYGLTATEVAVVIIPGVGQIIKGAGTAISKFVAWAITKQLAKTLGRAFTLRNLAETGAYLAADKAISAIAIAHAVQSMGGVYNGLVTGEEYLNQVDAGAELFGQEMVRAYGGRPLTEAQYAASEKADEEFRVATIQNQSFAERYFARSNPQSLVNRLGVASYLAVQNFNATERLGGLMRGAARLLNPAQLIGSLTSIFGGKSFAIDIGGEEPDSLVLREDYGITPFDWTQDEMEALKHDPEYSMLVNEDELNVSGRKTEIMQKYRRCFDLNTPVGDLLAGNPERGQIFGIIKGDFSGALEKLPAIVRDSNANVDPDKGICAPNNLGDSGPDGDGQLTFKNEEAKLAFRYRVWLAHHCALDDLLAIQELKSDSGCGAGNSTRTAGLMSGRGKVNPDGYAFPLDPTLPLSNIPCNKNTCHHDGTAAFDLMFNGIAGQPVFAISDGEVLYSTHSQGSCYSIQFKSSLDGYNYWYGHITNPIEPGPVKAGQKIAEVDRHENDGGDNHCGFDSYGNKISGASHLHIDRASAPGRTAGYVNDRDPCFVPLLNNIWAVANGQPAIYSREGC